MTRRFWNILSPAAALYILVAVVVTAGLLLWDRATPDARAVDPSDPRVRARAAAQSITGERTVRRVEIPEPGLAVVHASSKYYKREAPLKENREYLATEGRLIVQLILFDMPEMRRARVELYAGRRRVAVVEGRGDQAYGQYQVTYDGPLAQ